MRIAFIADGRAEHTRRWVRYFAASGDTVLVLSTYPCRLDIKGVAVRILPGLFRPGDALVKTSERDRSPRGVSGAARFILRTRLDQRIRPLWHQVTVLDVLPQAFAAARHLRRFRPDIAHALRIPNEGYVAALAGYHPWVLSAWGQDFIYTGASYAVHRRLLRFAVRRPDGLTADCQRDIRLSREYGLPAHTPGVFFPGNGGVDTRLYQPGLPAAQRERLVLYPRGVAPYLRVDTLLDAAGLLLEEEVDIRFLLLAPPALIPIVRRAAEARRLPDERVAVAAFQPQPALVGLLQRAAVIVSPSMSDGTPNSMLEGMACGAFPVIGDIESVREWITHGENGLLFDPQDAPGLAACIRQALDNPQMRQAAEAVNARLIGERADYAQVMPRVRAFYTSVIQARADAGI
ncbi:MAG: glycosyltransferase [Armatimonadetes bacterium]|nr:glycosyltransferase [Armatimonadota bacterium]